MGLYFEQLESFGENVQIVFEKMEKEVFSIMPWDGTSSLESLINVQRNKKFSRHDDVSIIKKISGFLKFYFSLPYRPAYPKII